MAANGNPYTATSGSLGLGSSAPSNPYLSSQVTALTNASNQNLQNNVLPGVDGGAVAAGGYGGSRQGIADANAISQSQTGLDSSIANLYGNAYAQDQNYNLGLGSLANTAQANQNNFYSQNRQLDQSGQALGANLVTNANSGLVGQGAGVAGVGTTQQQAPWQVTNNAGNAFSQYAGLGGSQIGTQQGSTLGAIAGGAIAGTQLANNLGLGQTNYGSSGAPLISNSTPGFSGLPDYAIYPQTGG